jgi:C4-dicarboxylate transporter, DctM subunit
LSGFKKLEIKAGNKNMSPVIVGLIGIALLFFLLFVMRFSIATGMAVVGFAGLWYLKSFGAASMILSIIPFELITDYSFTTLPLFVFMACVLTNVGFGDDLYVAVSRWIGHIRGGLVAATIASMAVLGAVTPSSMANLTIMGRMAFPEMTRRGYAKTVAAGCIASGAGLGSIIPPSGPLIIYGVLTGVSIGKLFVAGILPGITLAILLIVTASIICMFNPKLAPPGPKYGWQERFIALGGCIEIIILIIFMLYGIIAGWFTPNEAGATGCVVTILSTFLRKRFSLKMLNQSLKETLLFSGMLYFMLAGVFVFTAFCVTSNISISLAALVDSLHVSRFMVMGFIFVVYFMLGCIMAVPEMIALTLPVFFPVITALGFDPVWFGIELMVLCEIANITPPIALNVWVLSTVLKDQVSMETIYRGIVPFLLVEVIFLVVLLFLPQIALFLPGLMK